MAQPYSFYCLFVNTRHHTGQVRTHGAAHLVSKSDVHIPWPLGCAGICKCISIDCHFHRLSPTFARECSLDAHHNLLLLITSYLIFLQSVVQAITNMYFTRGTSAAILAAIPAVLGQTFTDCDPTKKTCPNDTGLIAGSYLADFTKGSSANASWSAAAYTTLQYSNLGAEFQIAQKGQAPTIQTDFYIFFGRIDVKMRAAPGQGIVSSIVLESDDLDEIDWEFLGGNTAQVETNYFGKGNTSTYDRATYLAVSTPQTTIHTYTIDWTKDSVVWMIDGTTVRTLQYSDANGGHVSAQMYRGTMAMLTRSRTSLKRQ